MAGTRRTKKATRRSERNDRPRERARIAEEENRNLCLELQTLRARYEALVMIQALSSITPGEKTPREWIDMAVDYVRKYESKTLTEGVKQETD